MKNFDNSTPFSKNPFYHIMNNEICYFCENGVGRKKFYHSLWKLYSHMTWWHKSEPRLKEIIMELADKIIKDNSK